MFQDGFENFEGKGDEHGFVAFCVCRGGESGGRGGLELQGEVGEKVMDYIGKHACCERWIGARMREEGFKGVWNG